MVCECVWEQSHGFRTTPLHKPPTCMLLWGAPTKSLKCRIPNSGVLKTSRADGPHLQMCVCGEGVSNLKVLRRDTPEVSETTTMGEGRSWSQREREGKEEGGEGAARGGLGHCLLEFGSL